MHHIFMTQQGPVLGIVSRKPIQIVSNGPAGPKGHSIILRTKCCIFEGRKVIWQTDVWERRVKNEARENIEGLVTFRLLLHFLKEKKKQKDFTLSYHFQKRQKIFFPN